MSYVRITDWEPEKGKDFNHCLYEYILKRYGELDEETMIEIHLNDGGFILPWGFVVECERAYTNEH